MNGLDRIREAAARDRSLRFTNLMHHLTPELLRGAYDALKRNAAAGVDDVTWQEYGEGVERRIKDLHDRVQSGRYRAKPSKRVWLPKPGGGQRPIGIAALEDKIVQQGAVRVLSQIYEKDFYRFSYGFRPERSPHEVMLRVRIRAGGVWQRTSLPRMQREISSEGMLPSFFTFPLPIFLLFPTLPLQL